MLPRADTLNKMFPRGAKRCGDLIEWVIVEHGLPWQEDEEI